MTLQIENTKNSELLEKQEVPKVPNLPSDLLRPEKILTSLR